MQQANANKIAELKKQLEAQKTETARAIATTLASELHALEHGPVECTDIPDTRNPFLRMRLLSAQFMALRDELTSAYCRMEAVAEEKAVLAKRKEEDAFRSDVERASTERSLEYFQTLEDHYEEVKYLIQQTVGSYEAAKKEFVAEQDERQSDVPPEERVYPAVPSLRWASNAEKQKSGWETENDIRRMTQQAEFWI